MIYEDNITKKIYLKLFVCLCIKSIIKLIVFQQLLDDNKVFADTEENFNKTKTLKNNDYLQEIIQTRIKNQIKNAT
jgi:hypothetical protein